MTNENSNINIRGILTQIALPQNKKLSQAIKSKINKDNLIKNWEKIVGPKLAEHIQPLSVEDQRIIIAVDEPAWLAVMRTSKKEISQKINDFLTSLNKNPWGKRKVVRADSRTVEFVLRPLPAYDKNHFLSQIKGSTPEEHALNTEQKKKLEKLISNIQNNDQLKKVVKDVLTKYYQENQTPDSYQEGNVKHTLK